MLLVLLSFLVFIGISKADLDPQNYPYSTNLGNQNVFLEWRLLGGDSIEIQITAPTTGWFGLGFSPNGGMKGADIVVGWVDNDGKPHLEDRFATDFIEPTLDKQQDWKLIGSSKTDSNVVFRMSRKLVTCDPNDIPITNDTTRLIYASNPEKPTNDNGQYHLMKHIPESKAVKSLYLFDSTDRSEASAVNPGENIKKIPFRVSPNVIPPKDTYYWCEIIPFPKVDNTDLHMIGMQPYFTPGNEDLVHHMLPYICTPKITAAFPKKRGVDCDQDLEHMQVECVNLIGGWAKGGNPSYLPKEMAFPLKQHFDSKGYLMWQMHYDNPPLASGRVDSSGMDLIVVDRPRKITAGSFRLGSFAVDWRLIVPPMMKDFVLRAECPSDCTKDKLPKEGIQLVLGAMHTHLLGTKVFVRHIRDGKELPPIMKDEPYDHDYQDFRVLQNSSVILPGDSIITECVYTNTKNIPVLGGESTREEMCLVFGFYYPAVDLSFCTTSPDFSEMAKAYEYPPAMQGPWNYTTMTPGITDYLLHKYDWSEANKQKSMKAQGDVRIDYACVGDKDPTKGLFDKHIQGITKFTPYIPPDSCKGSSSTASSASSMFSGFSIMNIISFLTVLGQSVLAKMGIV